MGQKKKRPEKTEQSQEAKTDSELWIRGEITSEELTRRTVSRYQS